MTNLDAFIDPQALMTAATDLEQEDTMGGDCGAVALTTTAIGGVVSGLTAGAVCVALPYIAPYIGTIYGWLAS